MANVPDYEGHSASEPHGQLRDTARAVSILQTTLSDDKRVTINVRRESTVVMENNDTTFTFDYEGRLIGAFLDGRNYRRSLDNEILEKASGETPGLGARVRRFLTRQEVQLIEIRAYEFARALAAKIAELRTRQDGFDPSDLDTAIGALERVNRYGFIRLEQERLLFKEIYKPVTILPPDQYLALYLQATEGCVFNACAFCGLYRDRRFRVKSLDEFRDHILRVRAFFGGGLSYRRSIFLGDANALMIPQTQLVPLFELINTEFAIAPSAAVESEEAVWNATHPIHFSGIYSFIDAYTTRRKTSRDFQQLARRGLRRVYLGLETGDDSLLQWLGKPNTSSDVLRLVDHLKVAGVAIGIIILVGAGGDKFQDAHIRGTARLINAMPLDQNDLIYFSELVDYPGSTYSEHAARTGIRALTLGEIEHQMTMLRAGFEFHGARAPKISYYDIREFVY